MPDSFSRSMTHFQTSGGTPTHFQTSGGTLTHFVTSGGTLTHFLGPKYVRDHKI
jgi:hypothetical protein